MSEVLFLRGHEIVLVSDGFCVCRGCLLEAVAPSHIAEVKVCPSASLVRV
jgi:hypothetical protein